ncbi:antirestriction protein ArdA [Notoacmeibacter marinus]|uniref:Antirestriction protein ArdA n=1 Tax=Notoacmeibacter marinus TaxID=1876515 RepID=A0A231V0E2_9HYPH|nr:antirestriction protein ArdA [Notoacmeibacter marinus]OXT01642.1 antirestriction protein ArdA [Notoacmeibacter marinus]
MPPLLYAQPYNIDAEGFFFRTESEYSLQAQHIRDRFGNYVEEFEIQFIDGEALDGELAGAMGLSQGNVARFFELADDWDEDQKIHFIIAVGEGGYPFDLDSDDPDALDIDIYEIESLLELAREFVDEGLFGDIPDRLQCYLDFEAIARDLGIDYSMTGIAGRRFAFRCG